MLTAGTALLLKTAQASFWNSYFAYSDPFEGIVYNKASSQATDTYARLGAAPMPEEWVGDGNVKAAPEFSYTLGNKFWKAGVRIDKSLIRFQQWDEIANLTGNLGTKARAHMTKRLTTYLEGAHATTGADGQLFFDTDHTWPGAEYTTVWDNDLTANATAASLVTLAELQTAIKACVAKLFSVYDDRGDPEFPAELNPADLVVMYPSQYINVVHQLLTVDSITNPGDNDLKGRFTPRLNQFMTAATDTLGLIFVFLKGTPRYPLVLQTNGDVSFGDNLMGDEYRSSGNAVFDAAWVGEAGPGDHGKAVRYAFT